MEMDFDTVCIRLLDARVVCEMDTLIYSNVSYSYLMDD